MHIEKNTGSRINSCGSPYYIICDVGVATLTLIKFFVKVEITFNPIPREMGLKDSSQIESPFMIFRYDFFTQQVRFLYHGLYQSVQLCVKSLGQEQLLIDSSNFLKEDRLPHFRNCIARVRKMCLFLHFLLERIS